MNNSQFYFRSINKFVFLILILISVNTCAQLNVSFTFDPNNAACSGTTINFTSNVTGGTPPFVYNWDFDDSNVSNVANPTHIFDAFGCNNEDFTVNLTVTDTTGGGSVQASDSEIVTVKQRPNPQLDDLLNIPDFSNCYNNPTPQNSEFLIEVNNITSNTSCIISDSYSIDWGDGTTILTGLTIDSFPIEHLYTELGAYLLNFSCESSNGCSGLTTDTVKNESNPAVSLATQGNTEECAPVTFPFIIDTSIIANNSPYTIYEWDFGDGSPHVIWDHQTVLDSIGIIHHTYLVSSCPLPYPNYYTVSVTAANSCSSTTASVDAVEIWSITKADFEIPSEVKKCVGLPIFFDNLSIPGYGPGCQIQNTYYWDFGNGHTHSGQYPDPQTYDSAGVYIVTLIGGGYCGNDTLIMELLILEPPTAVASADQNSGCVDFDVNFINESFGDSLSYLWTVEPENGWEFVAPASDTSKNPVIKFQEFNDYIMTLKTSNVCDDSFDTVMIHAMDKPVAIFEDITLATCDLPYYYNADENAINYIENGSSITSYQWLFPGGNPSSSNDPYPTGIEYSNSGTYTINLVVTNFCGEYAAGQTLNITDPVTPVVSPVDTAICLHSDTFSLVVDTILFEGSWSGDIVDEDGCVKPDSVGDFDLTFSGYCIITTTVHVKVLPLPEAIIITPDTGMCIDDDTLHLKGSPPGGEWTGTGIVDDSLGIFNPAISGAGVFDIYYTRDTIHDTVVCHKSDTIRITVDSKPIVSFKPDSNVYCIERVYKFINTTTEGNSNSITWNFGGTIIQNQDTVYYTFADTGVFNFGITAESLYGCNNSLERTFYVIEPPPQPVFSLSFNPPSQCCPDSVSIYFDNSMYDDFVTYLWNFGNGDTLNTTNTFNDTTIIYNCGNSDTSYIITAGIKNICGIISYSDTFDVYAMPDAKFSKQPDYPCSPVTVLFLNETKEQTDTLIWIFGDGTFDTIINPQWWDDSVHHTFYTDTIPRKYIIKMIAINKCGIDTIIDSIAVYPNTMIALFNTSDDIGCSPLEVTFENHSSSHADSIKWCIYNNGVLVYHSQNNPDTLRYVFKNFQSGIDTFMVQLRVSDAYLCGRDTAYKEIIVFPQPLMTFSVNDSSVCAREPIVMINESGIGYVLWNYGDGDSLYTNEVFVTHAYDSTGIYSVSLTGVNEHGCISTASKNIRIKPSPQAFAIPDAFTGCIPFTVNFDCDSSFSHLWDFGDGTHISTVPEHTFLNPGLYQVIMISEYHNECKDTASIEIRVLPKPTSLFSHISSGTYPETLTLTNTSIDAINCFWDFGNGFVSNSCENQTVTYENVGIYHISLITINQYNCSDTFSIEYDVFYKGLYVPNAFEPLSTNTEINTFMPVGIGIKQYLIQVYDTWGNLIWESSRIIDGQPAEGWDGKDESGNFYPQDVYIWKINAVFLDNSIWEGMNGKNVGNVTLIR